MDAADGSGENSGLSKKRRRKIYASTKESRNSRRRELYAQARELRDARLQEVDAQRGAIAVIHKHRPRRKRIVEEALPLNSTISDASAIFSCNAYEIGICVFNLNEILDNNYLLESEKIKYYTMSVLSPDDKSTDVEDITFLYRLVPGCTHLSYGLHCALLAGVPEEVIKRAESILEATGNKKNIERVCSENISARDQLYKAAVEKMLAFDTSNGDLGHFFEDIFPSHHQEDENPFNSLSLSQGMGLCNSR